jgi:hypothetical protein
MGWDATLRCDHCNLSRDEDWNYTHNINKMLNAALEKCRTENPNELLFKGGEDWLSCLDGMSADHSIFFLNFLVAELEADERKYRHFNPANNWGSYDTIIPVLKKMRDVASEESSKNLMWSVSR